MDRSSRRFVRTEAAGGVALVVAAVVAMAWANSPWQHGYASFADGVRPAVNDGLMALFFFVVGLEIKRELVHGELRDRRAAALPAFGAVGGMVVPALVYASFTHGGAGGHGWGIPMATDIAFALGVAALLGPRVPPSSKLFLLTLAIVDDVGAIVVIALFYRTSIDVGALAIAVLALAVAVALARRGPWVVPALAVVGWYATRRSGVHPTIAGVAFALAVPAGHPASQPGVDERTRSRRATASGAVLLALEARLHPVTSLLVLPAFALVNAGVSFRGGLFDRPGASAVAAGVVIGLVAGKVVGIVAGSALGVRLGAAVLPTGSRWPDLIAVASLGGIGFTVSLFVTALAFGDGALADAAKVSVLAASVASSLVGAALLARRARPATR